MHDNIPDVYAVFKLGDDPRSAAVAAQGLKIMEFVDAAVKGMDNMDGVDKKLAELSQRHTKYGAKKAHFGVSRQAVHCMAKRRNIATEHLSEK